MNTKKKNLTKQICVLALLTAAGVVLGRLVPVVNLWNTKIEFAFVAVMLAACISGPIGGAVVGALVDFIGAILMPTGAYFPGFTVTAAITGLVFGLLLYKKSISRESSLPCSPLSLFADCFSTRCSSQFFTQRLSPHCLQQELYSSS